VAGGHLLAIKLKLDVCCIFSSVFIFYFGDIQQTSNFNKIGLIVDVNICL
jgi:hypothetical protein